MENDDGWYVMTRRTVRAAGNTSKLNLTSSFPFEPGTIVEVRLEDVCGMIPPYKGFRKVHKSGNSRAIIVPQFWGYPMGTMVRAYMREASP